MTTILFTDALSSRANWAAMLKTARDDYRKKRVDSTDHDESEEFESWLEENFSAKLMHTMLPMAGIVGITFDDDAAYTMFLLKYNTRKFRA